MVGFYRHSLVFSYVLLCVIGLNIASVSSIFVETQPTSSSSPINERGLIITPTITEVEIDKNDIQDITINLENDSLLGDNLKISPSLQYFAGSEEDGVPTITQTPSTTLNQPQVSFENNQIDLPKSSKVESKVRISTSENVAPGGYYYALTYTTSPEKQESEGSQIKLQRSIVSLLFVNVKGKVDKEASFSVFNIHNHVLHDPFFDDLHIDYSIQVKGNTFIRPNGNIFLYVSDKQSINLPINEDSKIILPNTSRKFNLHLNSFWNSLKQNKEVKTSKTIPWNLIGSKKIGGKILFSDGEGEIKQTEVSKNVIFFPWKLLLIGSILIIVSVIIIKLLISRRKKYDQS